MNSIFFTDVTMSQIYDSTLSEEKILIFNINILYISLFHIQIMISILDLNFES